MTALDQVEFLLTNGYEREVQDHCDTLNIDCSAIHLGEPLLFSVARLGRVNLVQELVDDGGAGYTSRHQPPLSQVSEKSDFFSFYIHLHNRS